ncbi:MAG TPA: PAS domain-containing sensor histidine kinase [Devosiaceae bacterium]
MNDTAADIPEDPPERSTGTQVSAHAWLRGGRIVRYLGMAIVFAAVVVASVSFLIVTGATGIEPNQQTWAVIWIINAVLILLVIALVLTEIMVLVQSRRRQHAGSRLQVRMVTMFALVAAAPAFIVAVVATIALNQGLDQWFSERTRAMVESSRLVARSYMFEHAQVLRDDIIWVASELESAKGTFETDRDKYVRILTALAQTRSLPFASLVSHTGDTLMRALINTPGKPPNVPPHIMPDVGEGAPTLIAPGSTNLVGAVVKLKGYDDVYLFVARPVDPEVLEYMRLTDQNISEYRQYASNRMVFQITFTIMYVGLAFVLLLAALWIGIALANRFVNPIRNLMLASSRVSQGDLNVQVPVHEARGDLEELSARFNRMTQQLRSQRRALLDASETNEKRRQFTEAVVEGVSAGIVGLDPYGAVTLVNARACEMFGKTEVQLMGEGIAAVVPELGPIVERAKSARRGQIRDQIQLATTTEPRTYQVKLTREGTMTESKGFVVTLDDITDLVTAQRTSAWADVARRIAHEIKNPLTPIQLSAERLQRRFSKKLGDDAEVFDKLTNTIVRQVGDIGRMVDEFSSFARMPSAAIEEGDLSDTIRQAVFLESVRQPAINIHADLPEDPIIAWFDSRLMAQALTNLIKNAVEAIESTGIDEINAPEIRVSAAVEGDDVRIKVSDNGKGWPQEGRQRLLEPYMTTREKGTGLGLAIVAKIIEQHGGSVELIDAEPDAHGRVGACFSFTLPFQGREKLRKAPGIEDETGRGDDEPALQGEPHLTTAEGK